MGERRWQMTKVRAGSYLLPSNDTKTLWHIYSFEDGRSYGLDEPDRTWWACARFLGTYAQSLVSIASDLEEFGYITHDEWREEASYLRTRQEAIEAALRG